ncbi:MAG: PAS domain S-box protein [Acetobacteraceae bacterium]|nr:PAS domain S-box protein [Acetobacteraceae bacterium]
MTDETPCAEAPQTAPPAPGEARTAARGTAVRELELLRAAVDAVGEAIVITGPELNPPGPRIEYVNAGFTRVTGYTAEEVVGRTPRILQGPNTDRAVLDQLRVALEGGQPVRSEAVNYRRDGTEFFIEWLITPVFDGEGRVSHWVSAQRDVTERRRAEARLRRLADEVNHRVNNTLAAVQSVTAQTLRVAPFAEEVRAALLGRPFALSRAHDLLARGYWAGAPLRDLAEAQLTPRQGENPERVEAVGPPVWLRPGAAVALGMALHELAANAAAHGALSVPGGRVRLDWSVEAAPGGDWLRLRWAERGGPTVPGPPARRGFGSRLIERGLAQELRAEARLLFEASGLRCEIDAPLEAVAGGRP